MNDLDDDLREGEPPPLPSEPRTYPIHPLFPLPEGVRETKEIVQISFDRWDHQGKKERCPDRFPASELTSLAQVVDMFGGGTYQFIGFDSRGAYSRWTPEKDKVRIGLPCKPFRQVETEPPLDAPPARAPQNDLVPLLLAAQERADRMLTALIERIASAPVAQSAAASPPVDPMAMLSGLATVMEKLRPPSGDMVSQLSSLVSVAKQIGGKGNSAAADADAAFQPILTMMTNALGQGATASPPVAAPSPPSSPPQTPPGLIWVEVPQVGPVMMRPEQAATVFAHLGGSAALAVPQSAPVPAAPSPPPPAPVAPPSAPSVPAVSTAHPSAMSWDDIAAKLRNPDEQAAFKRAIERLVSATGPTAVQPQPTAEPPAPVQVAPGLTAPPAPAARSAASSPAQPPAASAPPPPAPEQAPLQGPTCIVCGASGARDPAASNVLICRNNHRSLLSDPGGAGSDGDALIPVADLPIDQLEALLADEEFIREVPPEMLAMTRRELAARRTKARGAEQAP